MADPQDWHARAIGALGAVLAVALVVGGVVGAVAYGAAQVTGLTGGDPVALDPGAPGSPAAASSASSASASSKRAASDSTATPTEPAPPAKPTERPTPSRSPSPTPDHEHRHPQAHHHRKHAASGSLTLSASPHHVGHMGRIDLSGHYRGHDGATLVVQRFEAGHWARFPVTAQVRGGGFHTWVASGHRGPNRFRVVDESTGAASGAVTVRVG